MENCPCILMSSRSPTRYEYMSTQIEIHARWAREIWTNRISIPTKRPTQLPLPPPTLRLCCREMKKKHNLPRTCRHVWGWMNLLNGVPLHSHSRRANMSVWPVMVVSPSPFGLTFVNPTDPVQMEEVGKHRMNGFNHNNDIGKGITTTPLSMGTGQITVLFDILGTGWRRRKSMKQPPVLRVSSIPRIIFDSI